MAITVSKVRRIIGKTAEKSSDVEIQIMLSQFYDLAEIIANTLHSSGSNKRSKGIDGLNTEAHNESRS